MVDLRPDHLEIVKRILAERVPAYQVRAFGSRVCWTAQDTSDLDLVVMTDAPLGLARLADLREAFSESDLPFRVDVLDWAAIGVEFKEIIEQDNAVIQQPVSTGSSGPTRRRLGIAGEQYPMVPLNDVAEILDSMRIPVKKADRKPGPYPYYGASGIVDYVDSYIFDGEYLLLAEDGENLRSQNTPIAFMATGKFWVNNHAHILQGNASGVTRFLCYALQTADVKSYLSGSTRPKLTQRDMKRIPIPCPPVDTQQAIACILGTLDDKIELNRRMNQTLEGMAQSIFKSWFVDFLPVRAKSRPEGSPRPFGSLPPHIADLFPDAFEESPLGLIPVGWQADTILTIGELLSGGTPSTKIPEYWNGNIKWVSAKDVRAAQDVFVLDTERTITQEGVDNSSTKILPELTTIVTARGTVGSYCILAEPMAMNQTNYGLKARRQDADYFVFFALGNLVSQLKQRAYGTIFDTVTTRTFKASQIVVPEGAVITEFDQHVRPLMEKIHQNLRQSRTLTALRDTLLPKLISGELRVPLDPKGLQDL